MDQRVEYMHVVYGHITSLFYGTISQLLTEKLTIYEDVADLIESKAVSKDTHEWEQSTIEAEHMIKPLTVEGNISIRSIYGIWNNWRSYIKSEKEIYWN